jgi:hypothetical protein
MSQDYIPLATVTLASSSASVTFSNIPATYRDLVLVLEGTSSSPANMNAFYNGDTSNGTSVFAAGDGTITGSGTNPTNYVGGVYGSNRSINILQIMDYSATNKHKTTLFRLSVAGTIATMGAARWASTAAITSVQLDLDGAITFSSGTTFSLYGIVG